MVVLHDDIINIQTDLHNRNVSLKNCMIKVGFPSIKDSELSTLTRILPMREFTRLLLCPLSFTYKDLFQILQYLSNYCCFKHSKSGFHNGIFRKWFVYQKLLCPIIKFQCSSFQQRYRNQTNVSKCQVTTVSTREQGCRGLNSITKYR